MIAGLEKLRDLGVLDELKTLGTAGASRRTRAAFDEFVLKTGNDWSRMARELYRRWQVPAAVQPEDILAELLAAAWKVLPDWDPGKRPLAEYVCWNAYARARKWINQQRDAYRRDGKNHSRHPIAESTLLCASGVQDGTDRRRSVIDQEESVWFQEAYSAEERIDGGKLGRQIAETLPPDEAEAFMLLVEEATRGRPRAPEYRAARKLSGEARLRNGLGSQKKVAGFINRAGRNAVKIAEKLNDAAA